MGAARRAEAEEDGVRNTRQPDLPKPAARVLPDAPVPKPEAPTPNFERHAASSGADAVHRSPTRNALRPLRRNVSARSGVATLLRATAYPANTRRAARSRRNGRSRQQQHGANGTHRAAAAPAIRPRPSSRCRERNTPRRPTTTQILNQFAIRRWRASRCSARRRLSRCRYSEAAIPNSLKVALAGADQNWANVVRRRQAVDVVDVLPVREPAPAGHEPPPRLPEDQLSAEDRAFIRRIAPPAAE